MWAWSKDSNSFQCIQSSNTLLSIHHGTAMDKTVKNKPAEQHTIVLQHELHPQQWSSHCPGIWWPARPPSISE